jgi:hypothetical protein
VDVSREFEERDACFDLLAGRRSESLGFSKDEPLLLSALGKYASVHVLVDFS